KIASVSCVAPPEASVSPMMAPPRRMPPPVMSPPAPVPMTASYQTDEPTYDDADFDDVAAAVGGDDLGADPTLPGIPAMRPVQDLIGASARVGNMYLAHLTQLALELEGCATAGADAGAIRLLRQRLTQWIEDVRS